MTTASFELPLELRNQVTRVEIAGERSAGAVSLLDARAQWHRVGLLSGESREASQPLLASLYYIQRALAPFAELVQPPDSNLAAGVDLILKQNASVLVMADIGTLTGDVKQRVEDWVKKGGVLVRFAGPRLEKGGDDLLPVPLRLGGRTLGGALSWAVPQPVAPFGEDSIFTGLNVPSEVVVNRQVLADPARLGTDAKIWAQLKDGTPLVTAAKRGDGQLVLFHITANSDWSNLPLSGLFVDMLRRLSVLGKSSGSASGEATLESGGKADAAANDAASVLSPSQVLDGYGTLKRPPPTALAIKASELANIKASADHPPGYYGPQSAPRALNLAGPGTELKPLPAPPSGASQRAYSVETATPLKSWLLALALALLFVDILAVVLLQAGGLAIGALRPRPAVRAGLALLIAGFALASAGAGDGVLAQSATGRPADRRADDAMRSRLQASCRSDTSSPGTRRPTIRAAWGLIGLGRVLTSRTAVEPGEPFGVNIASDEIAFFPILYWPVLANAQVLSEATLAKIDAYMKQGGMIIFDTRDYGQGMPSGLPSAGREGTALQRLLGQLDIPRLEGVPGNHVLTKSFYLLRNFPGRWDGGVCGSRPKPGRSDRWRQARSCRRRQRHSRHVERSRRPPGRLMSATGRSFP